MPSFRSYPVKLRPLSRLAVGLLALAGCDLNDEDSLRAGLSAYFKLGDTLYFESRLTCTMAVFRARSNDPSDTLVLAEDVATAQEAFRQTGTAAMRRADSSPASLADALLLSEDGALGKQALGAAALSEKCVDETRSAQVGRALAGEGNLIGYSRSLGGMFVLDGVRRMLFFIAGEPL